VETEDFWLRELGQRLAILDVGFVFAELGGKVDA